MILQQPARSGERAVVVWGRLLPPPQRPRRDIHIDGPAVQCAERSGVERSSEPDPERMEEGTPGYAHPFEDGLLGFRLPGLEVQRNGVNAVPQSGGVGTVIEDMAQVRITPGAQHFRPAHEQ